MLFRAGRASRCEHEIRSEVHAVHGQGSRHRGQDCCVQEVKIMTAQTTTKFCSNCGEKIDVHAEICPHCGVRVMTPPSTKNPTTAVILSFFVIGLWQVYNGKYTKALIMFVLAIVSAMLWGIGIGVITSLIIWIWSMNDAWNVAKGTGGSTSGSVNTVVAVVGGFILLIFISEL